MAQQEVSAYGSWTSPITSASIAGSSVSLNYLNLHQSTLYWIEGRPTEKGRNVITTIDKADGDEEKKADTDVDATAVNKMDITPKELNSSSRVHEYGGMPFIVLKDGRHLTSNDDDGKLYVLNDTEDYEAITDEYSLGKYLYCDMDQNPMRPSQVYAVREEHMSDDKPSEVVNCLVCIDMDTKEQKVIASGNTFYSYPRCDPHGRYLAYITWNHPNMPWDNTILCLATLNSITGQIVASCIIDSASSIIQPKWSNDGKDLYYISDQREYWELFRYNVDTKQSRAVLLDVKRMEFGWPCWNIGKQRYDLMNDDTIYAAAIENGTSKLVKIEHIRDKNKSKLTVIELDATQISYIEELHCDVEKQQIYFLGGGPMRPTSIFVHDIKDDGNKQIVPKILVSSGNTVDAKYISIPQTRAFKTSGNQTAYAYVYEPKNDDVKTDADGDSKPPLLVLSHGGPTSAASSVYNEGILFFTSRGWMVANVNYRGSTGYGTIYRESLKLQWGLYDKDDCCAIAECLKAEKKVNPKQCAIRGGSAGGYTTLCCLTMDEKRTFNAGCSRYGVADLELLLKETHKFEAEYLFPLIGDEKQTYKDRSPIYCVDRLKCPVLFLHGELDRVVPLNQAEIMFEAMKKNKITTALEVFDGEYHGFKKAESKIAAMDFEYRFYSEILGFALSKQDDENMKKPNIVHGESNKQ